MRLLTIRCAAQTGLSRAEQLRSALFMIGSALGVSVSYVGLKRITGDNLFVEALGIAVFPMALIVGTTHPYLRDHSPAARVVLIAVALILVYLAALLAAWT